MSACPPEAAGTGRGADHLRQGEHGVAMAVELVAEHVRVQPDRMGARADGEGEVTAFEPPWLVGYRLSAGPRTVWLRATCTAAAGGTRIHLHQAGGPRGKAIIRL